MSGLGNPQLYFEVRDFQAREVAALQAADYDSWLALMAPEIVYRVPIVEVNEEASRTESTSGELAYFEDNLETLKLRIARMRSRFAWSEIPPSRVRYFVEPHGIEEGAGEVRVGSNVIVYQTRLQREENWYVGRRHDRLRRTGSGLVLVERIAHVDRTVLPGKNLTVFI